MIDWINKIHEKGFHHLVEFFIFESQAQSHGHTHQQNCFLPYFSHTQRETFFFCNSCTSILVMCLWNWAKSKHNNPRKIHGSAPVIPLMTSLMKVTTLQNTGHSLCLYCTEWEWLEETSSTHLWLVTADYADSPPGSVAICTKIDVCSWQWPFI